MFNQAMEFLYDSEFHEIGIMIIDYRAQVVFSNKKAKLLYSVADGIGLSPDSNLHAILRLCLEQQKSLSGIPVREPGTDPSSSLALYAYPLRDSRDKPFLFVIILDSNPLYEFYKNQSSREKLDLIGKMAAATANVILNPLTVIKGMLQLMEQHFNSYVSMVGLPLSPVHDKMHRYFDTVQNEIQTIDKHIQRFLLIGKPAEISLKRIQILSFLDQLVPSIRRKVFEKGLRFICEYPANDGEILGHPVYLEDALQALLQNAVEATSAGGSIVLRTEMTEQQVRFFIIDHGEGIPKDIIPQIGDPFVTTKTEALGLGLSYSYQIIQKMGGKLDIQSLPEGTQVQVSFSRVK